MRTLILVVSYPLITHYSVVSQNPWPALILLCLIAASVFGAKHHGKRVTWGVVLSIAGLALAGFALFKLLQHYEFAVLYFPPIFISFGLAFLFGRTLLPGKTPLITHMALIYHGGQMEPALFAYTRWVTIAWVLLFTFLGVESIFLAAFTSLDTWSLYTNCLNYLFILALIVGEHFIRIWRFSHIEFPGFVGFLRLLKQTDFSSLFKN